MRRNTTNTPAGLRQLPTGSLVATNLTLRDLVRYAWALSEPWQKLEGSSPLLDHRFDVNAKAPGPVRLTRNHRIGTLNTMLQALLAERFGLEVRWDDQQQDGYELTLINGQVGPRLRRSEVSCGDDRNYRRVADQGPLRCRFSYSQGKFSATGVTMTDMAHYFGGLAMLQRPVIDRTGLTGTYDLEMTFTRAGLPSPTGDLLPPGMKPGDEIQLPGPSLFTALRQEAGLRLEERRLPIPVLVVTRVGPFVEN